MIPPKIIKPKTGAVFFNLYQYPEIIIAIVITIELSIFIYKYNPLATHDGLAHLTWQYFWDQQFLRGNFFPKWNEGGYGGLGSPSFIFYPPLVRTLSFPFACLNLSPVQQLKGCYISLITINAIGLVSISQILFKPKFIRCIVIFLGTFNPFLIICIFKRGAIAEGAAIALTSFLMMGIYYVLNSDSKLVFLPLTIVFSALFLTHIPSSITLGSSYFISIIFLFIFHHLSRKKTLLLMSIPIIAALIDASFVFPLIFDVDLIQSIGAPPYEDRFLLFFDITKFLFSGFSLPNLAWDRTLFKTFFLNFLILVLTISLTRPWQLKDTKSKLMTQQIIMVAFALFMMTNLSIWLYQAISIFRNIQMPWRFLTVTSSLSPYLLGFTIESFMEKIPSLKRRLISISLITILLLITYKSANLYSFNFRSSKTIDSLLSYHEKISPQIIEKLKYQKVNDNYSLLNDVEVREKIYMTRDQYLFLNDVPWTLPATVSRDNWLNIKVGQKTYKNVLPPRLYSKVELVQGTGQFSIQMWSPSFRQLKVNNKTEVLLNLKTFYYPGWKIKLVPFLQEKMSESRLYAAPDGRMQLKLPPGVYTIKIWYQGTFAEHLGTIISIISLLLLLLFIVKYFLDGSLY